MTGTEEGLEDLESILTAPPPHLEAPLQPRRTRSSSRRVDLTLSCTLPAEPFSSSPSSPDLSSSQQDPGHLAASCPDLRSKAWDASGSSATHFPSGPCAARDTAEPDALWQDHAQHERHGCLADAQQSKTGPTLVSALDCHQVLGSSQETAHPNAQQSPASTSDQLDIKPSSTVYVHGSSSSSMGESSPSAAQASIMPEPTPAASQTSSSEGLAQDPGAPSPTAPSAAARPSPSMAYGLLPDPRSLMGQLQQQGEGLFRVATNWQSLTPWARKESIDGTQSSSASHSSQSPSLVELQQHSRLCSVDSAAVGTSSKPAATRPSNSEQSCPGTSPGTEHPADAAGMSVFSQPGMTSPTGPEHRSHSQSQEARQLLQAETGQNQASNIEQHLDGHSQRDEARPLLQAEAGTLSGASQARESDSSLQGTCESCGDNSSHEGGADSAASTSVASDAGRMALFSDGALLIPLASMERRRARLVRHPMLCLHEAICDSPVRPSDSHGVSTM